MKELYSWYRIGEKQKNQHQLEFWGNDTYFGKRIYSGKEWFIGEHKFLTKIWYETRIELINDFLDFHYSESFGDERIFLLRTREIIETALEEKEIAKNTTRNQEIIRWLAIKTKELEEKPKKPIKTVFYGFPLLDPNKNHERLTPLCHALVAERFIDSSPIIFKKIFTQSYKEGDKKINWIGNQIELVYFMHIFRKLIYTGNNPYKRLSNSFQINGENLKTSTGSLRTANADLKKKAPPRAKSLDKIFLQVFGSVEKH